MFKQHKLYFDSLTNIEKTAAINELQSKFDLDRKNREIEILNNQAQLKEKELYTNKLIRNGSIAGTFIVLVFAFILLANYRKKNAINRLLKEQNQRILDEQNKSENLLLNILPYETAQELKNKGQADARKYQRVTVMFTDFVNFTHITEQLEAEALVKEIHVLFSYFDEIMERLGIEKIKTIGDAYMCAAGIPKQIENDAELVVKAAIEIQKYISEQKLLREKDGRPVWDIRIGIHTGPVVAGIVGKKKFAYDIWGDTVNIASRMETSSQAGKINISETTYNQIKNIFTCINRGSIEVKNKGKVEMYFVEV